MKYLLFFATICVFTACNSADSSENDNINEGTTVPATQDSIPDNPSPTSPRDMPENTSPSTTDSSKLLQ